MMSSEVHFWSSVLWIAIGVLLWKEVNLADSAAMHCNVGLEGGKYSVHLNFNLLGVLASVLVFLSNLPFIFGQVFKLENMWQIV